MITSSASVSILKDFKNLKATTNGTILIHQEMNPELSEVDVDTMNVPTTGNIRTESPTMFLDISEFGQQSNLSDGVPFVGEIIDLRDPVC